MAAVGGCGRRRGPRAGEADELWWSVAGWPSDQHVAACLTGPSSRRARVGCATHRRWTTRRQGPDPSEGPKRVISLVLPSTSAWPGPRPVVGPSRSRGTGAAPWWLRRASTATPPPGWGVGVTGWPVAAGPPAGTDGTVERVGSMRTRTRRHGGLAGGRQAPVRGSRRTPSAASTGRRVAGPLADRGQGACAGQHRGQPPQPHRAKRVRRPRRWRGRRYGRGSRATTALRGASVAGAAADGQHQEEEKMERQARRSDWSWLRQPHDAGNRACSIPSSAHSPDHRQPDKPAICRGPDTPSEPSGSQRSPAGIVRAGRRCTPGETARRRTLIRMRPRFKSCRPTTALTSKGRPSCRSRRVAGYGSRLTWVPFLVIGVGSHPGGTVSPPRAARTQGGRPGPGALRAGIDATTVGEEPVHGGVGHADGWSVAGSQARGGGHAATVGRRGCSRPWHNPAPGLPSRFSSSQGCPWSVWERLTLFLPTAAVTRLPSNNSQVGPA